MKTENHLEKDSDQAIQTQINETSAREDRPHTSMHSVRYIRTKTLERFCLVASRKRLARECPGLGLITLHEFHRSTHPRVEFDLPRTTHTELQIVPLAFGPVKSIKSPEVISAHSEKMISMEIYTRLIVA